MNCILLSNLPHWVRKFFWVHSDFDKEGDAINITARMEHHGEVGKINISETTYEQAQEKFRGEYGG